MLRLLKFLLITLAVLVGIIVLAVGGLLLVPDDTYRGWMIAAVQSATGRELRIDDGFSLRVGRSIEVEARKVHLATAEWASEPALFAADRVSAKLHLPPLLQGIVEISLVAETPRVLLETDPSGRASWAMGEQTPHNGSRADSDGGGLNLVVIPTLKISQGRFVFTNGANGHREQLDVSTFDLGPKELQLRLALEGQYNDQSVSVSGELGEPRSILLGEQTETHVKVRLGANDLAWRGTYSALLAQAGPTVDIALSMAAPSTHDLEPFAAGLRVPDLGRLDIAARLQGSSGSYAANELTLELAGPAASQISASISGRVADIRAMSSIDLDLHARVPSLSVFSELAGAKLPETTPLTVNGKATVGKDPERTASIVAKIVSEWLNGDIDARISDIQSAALNGNIALQLESLTTLSGLVGRELPAMGPLEVAAKFASREGSYALTDLDLGIEDEALHLQLTGSVADLLAARGVDLTLEGKVASLAELSALAGTDLPDTPAVTMQAKLSAESGAQGPTDLAATISTANVKAALESTIPDIRNLDTLQMKLALDARSLADVGSLAGTELADLSPLKATAEVSASAQTIHVRALDLVLGESDLTGDIELALPREGTRGNAKGRFASTFLNVREFWSRDEQPTPAEQAPAEQETKLPGVDGDPDDTEQTSPSETASRVFSDAPLPVQILKAYDADIELSAQRMQLRNLRIDNGTTRVLLSNGALDVELLNAKVGEDPIAMAFKLDAGKNPMVFRFEFDADGVPVSGVLAEDSTLEGGLILIEMDLDGRGNSVREIMAGLDGHASFALKDSRFSNKWLSRFGGDILSQINPLSAKLGYAQIECSAVGFNIMDGLATTPRGLVSRETQAIWIGKGKINLKTEEIDFSFHSKPRKGLGISVAEFASLIQLGGTLSAPKLEADPEGVALKSAEAALAVGTLGASVLAKGLLNRVTSEQGVCEEIVDTILADKNPGEGLKQPAAKDKKSRDSGKAESGSANPSEPEQSPATPETDASSEDSAK